jgi:Mor family transcriptional regulator
MSEQQFDGTADYKELQHLLTDIDSLPPELRADVFNHLPAMLQSLVALFEAELKGVVKNPGQHAQRLMINQANYLGGIQTYIPRNDELKRMLRNIAIYNAHNRGALIEKLRVEHRLTTVQIYAIIKEQTPAERTRRQLKLF